MIHLDTADKNELLKILEMYTQYDIRAYGSRVKGKQKEFSDLDLCVMRDMPWEELDQFRAKLENSNVGIFVTIAQWNKLSDDFKSRIEKDLVPFDQW
jgi:uncharacterized protein